MKLEFQFETFRPVKQDRLFWSALGPLLFLMYIKYLPKCLNLLSKFKNCRIDR